MRNVLVLAVLGALALPAAAHPRSCGTGHGAYRGHHDGHRHYAARPYRAVYTAYRVSTRFGYDHFQRRHARFHHRYGYGHYGYGHHGWGYDCRPVIHYPGCGDHFAAFRHGYGAGYHSSPYVYYGFSPHVRNAELLSRLGTVFTVEGAPPGADTADYDGLPRAPARLVGARFVE